MARSVFSCVFGRTVMRIERTLVIVSLFLLLGFSSARISMAQRTTPASRSTGFTLFGDVEVSWEGTDQAKSLLFDVLLYSRSGFGGSPKSGQQRTLPLPQRPARDYDLVIEFENSEVARTQVRLIGTATDFRQDLALQWRAGSASRPKAATISAEDAYDRRPLTRTDLKRHKKHSIEKNMIRRLRSETDRIR